jgi:hypothetical protein
VLVKAVQMDKRRRVSRSTSTSSPSPPARRWHVHVPIESRGTAIGTKDGGQLDVQRREVHISVLPRLIPQGPSRSTSAGSRSATRCTCATSPGVLPEEAEILDDLDLAVVAVVPPRVAVEDEPAEEEVEPEVITKGAEDDDED